MVGNFPIASLVGKATRFKNQIYVGLNPITAIYKLCNLSGLQYPDL